jgi:hypothetical protein
MTENVNYSPVAQLAEQQSPKLKAAVRFRAGLPNLSNKVVTIMPSSKNYVRNYQQEYATESPERKHRRSLRVTARRMAKSIFGASAIRGKDIDHKQELGKGGSNRPTNLQPLSPSKNRSYARTRTGKMK